jgi:HAD superfamily hydrolase (TIGR01509 family)
VAVRAIVLDFDGLILDTESAHLRAWEHIYADHGVLLPLDGMLSNVGTLDVFDSLAPLAAALGERFDEGTIRATKRRLEEALIADLELLPGVEALISDAESLGLRLAVASSSDRAYVGRHLERRGLASRFACVSCGDEVRAVKPEPDVYLAVLEALGIAGREAIAFEDSPHGVSAAKRAGIFCVAVPSPVTHHMSFREADLVVDSLASVALRDLL